MTYPGGKGGSGVWQRIINQMPPHKTYVEAFLGGGSVLLAKRPAVASIGIDADAAVIEAWRSSPATTPNMTLVHGDGIAYLDANHTWSEDVLCYLDPPYLMSTRRQHRQIYRCELSDKDHERLLRVIKRMSCMVILSGYWSEMYSDALKNWRTDTFMTRTRGGALAEEWLWMNFDPPFALHDYRYLGENFRERERIKRKITRWKDRLIHMEPLEQHAIMAAISEINLSRTDENSVVRATSEPTWLTSPQL